jgi:Tol biopolymer transport system component
MMSRRIVAVDMTRVLLLATLLLLCGINVMPRGRVNSSLETDRATESATVKKALSAAQIFGDGLIAFSADDGQIYIMKADGSGLTRFTDNAPGVIYRYPAFSPDGSRIAFIRDADNEHALYISGLDGSNLGRLSSSPVALAEPAWSPDGSKIAYLRGYDLTYGGLANITVCGSEIYVIDVFSGKGMNLTHGAGGVDPAWSPDGTRIAFGSARDGNYDIYTMSPSGDEIKRLTHTDWAEAEPAWSPDGSRIAYTSHLKRVSYDCGFMSTGRPGGGTISDESTSVYVMAFDGTNQTKLAATTGGLEPSWSPDGTRLALVVNVKGDSQIYLTDAGGTTLVNLTEGSTQKSSPSWSYADKGR